MPPLHRLSEFCWELAREGGMRVPGRIYANDELMETLRHEKAVEQVANVAHLPGIVGYSLAMPDIHWGYGFPIGGVAATRPEDGVISPGGVGFDINCGVRLLRTTLERPGVEPHLDRLLDCIDGAIPAGVGGHGAIPKLSTEDLRDLARRGAAWAVDRGYGRPDDPAYIEEGGCLAGADPEAVGDRALQRGAPQIGTLGSGNHFLEIDVIDEVYDPVGADRLGLKPGGIAVLIHSGSRGFGYQICDDFARRMIGVSKKYGIELPDRQLACAPLTSPEAAEYLAAMKCAANYAWVNRQVIMSLTEGAIARALGRKPESCGFGLVYDVCHNIAKYEEHLVEGRPQRVMVHRKGATRALPPGHPLVPAAYKDGGQPVIVPGDMGRYSFVCLGAEGSLTQTFGSTCHGAGRVASRSQMQRQMGREDCRAIMKSRGVRVRAKSRAGLVEEMPEAYKDVEVVVDVMERAGVSRKVCRLKPLAVLKG
ncbi:MAG: RtcB family protein [Planctomycetes bacterium]|nr:RtcB family protein [Planctomycetota bacterium]